MVKHARSRTHDPSAPRDAQWAMVEPLLPPARQRPRAGCSRQIDRRAGLTTMFSLKRSGGQWALVPHDWLPKCTV